MDNNEFSNDDVLREVFELPKDWAKALYSIEYCLTKHSISQELNEEKRRRKEKWLQYWEEGIIAQFRSISNDFDFALVCDEYALQEYLRKLNLDSTQKSHAYLVIIEALFFRPYFKLDLQVNADEECSNQNLSYKLDIDYLSSLSQELNINKQLINRFQKRFKRSYMFLSGKATTVIICAVVAGVAIAVTAGVMAPSVALLFAAPGLYGAVAISSGLAAIGGGAVAIGGAGMLGGITVLVTTGGILGVVGGAGIGALVASSPALATIIAAKLEVYFREVLLPIINDPDKARNILRGQEAFIKTLNEQLEQSSSIPDSDKKAIKLLQKAIKVLQRGLDRNRNALLKFNA